MKKPDDVKCENCALFTKSNSDTGFCHLNDNGNRVLINYWCLQFTRDITWNQDEIIGLGGVISDKDEIARLRVEIKNMGNQISEQCLAIEKQGGVIINLTDEKTALINEAIILINERDEYKKRLGYAVEDAKYWKDYYHMANSKTGRED